MFRKINQKTIFILFIVLLVLVVVITIIDKNNNERTFKNDLVNVEADEVSQILLYPKSMNGEEVRLEKENDAWLVIQSDEKYPADQNAANSLIEELNRMKPESVVSTNENKWEQYEVVDSLGTRVKLMSKGKKIADVIIGKISFPQPQKANSFVRLEGDKTVYSVDGYLPMTFNRDLNSFRNKTITDVRKDDLTRLTFTNPNDGTFILEKGDTDWKIGSSSADSLAVASFISGLQNLKHSVFADDSTLGEPIYKLKIEGNNMSEAIELEGFAALNDKLIVTSSKNKGNYFDGVDLKQKIFPLRADFLK